ncbi:MAG TPA: LysM peptidoglycan-binding domain-containing protein [Anaeromyxobacteraceae bacterium]|nr:LysM peptidoglycan-binding domain-containing protein [Anaeromyxobacteraceae bacterium]
MRPISILPVLLFAASPALASGFPAAEAAAAAAQALPPAALPDGKLVPMGVAPRAPAPALATGLTLAAEFADPASIDAPDEPEIAREIERDSAEIEEVRKAEEAAHVTEAPERAPSGGGDRIALLPELDHGLARLQAEYDIPIEVNEAVVAYVRFFQSSAARGHFLKWLGRSHRYLDRYRAILREHGLPEDTVYLAMIESGFGNFAYSRARASGPWQFIASTGRLFGLSQDFWVDERRDPEKSARAAARFLSQLRAETGDWRLAWAGYNAGLGRIRRAQARGHEDFWDMASGRALRKETRGYVPKLMAAAILAKHTEEFGFRAAEIEKAAWIDYEEVEIPDATLLAVLARAAGIGERELIDLNPELRRACTPPRPYRLKIPKASVEKFAASWPTLKDRVRLTFAGHVVRRGDTLSGIAARYGVPTQGILEMNRIRSARRLRPGQELLIPRPVGGGTLARAETPRRPAEPRQEPVAEAPQGKTRATHLVQPGDTLWSISQRFGVTLGELCRWNGIVNPRRHTLQVGRTLVVFTGESG